MESPIGPLKSKVMLLQCSVDLPARAMVSNTKQFNGKYGCLYCYHPGKTEGSNHLHRFWPYTDSFCRTKDSYLKDMQNAVLGDDESVSHSTLYSCTCLWFYTQ